MQLNIDLINLILSCINMSFKFHETLALITSDIVT